MGFATDLYATGWASESTRYVWLLLASIAALAVYYKYKARRINDFPTINAYPEDWTLRRSHEVFSADARELIHRGFEKFKGPFRIITSLGSRVILPAEYAEWVKRNNDLDHQEFVREEFFAGYPGFEGVTAVADPSGMLIKITKNKLAQSSQIQQFFDQASKGVAENWGDETAWQDAKWPEMGVKMIGLMSASVFVGAHLAQSSLWQQISTSYAVTMFMAFRALRDVPRWTRPILHWFLPACRSCRAEVKRARNMLQDQLIDRKTSKAQDDGKGPKYDDTITWINDLAAGREYDPVSIQLGFSMAAIVTTSELLKQTLIEICSHPALIEPLRAEIDASVAAHGWTTAGLFNMRLLDSVIKETQRVNPGSEVSLERKAVRDTTMPNGQVIPRGTITSVWTSQFRNSEVYENPDEFDGYRFMKLGEEGGKWKSATSAVSTSVDHFVFGMGKAICPGRFFAIAEVKTAIAVILTGYDVRLRPGYKAKTIRYGFEILTDPAAAVEIRRRI